MRQKYNNAPPHNLTLSLVFQSLPSLHKSVPNFPSTASVDIWSCFDSFPKPTCRINSKLSLFIFKVFVRPTISWFLQLIIMTNTKDKMSLLAILSFLQKMASYNAFSKWSSLLGGGAVPGRLMEDDSPEMRLSCLSISIKMLSGPSSLKPDNTEERPLLDMDLLFTLLRFELLSSSLRISSLTITYRQYYFINPFGLPTFSLCKNLLFHKL